MKVLQVNTVCTGASTATICVQLARLVNAQGGESLIAFGRGEAVSSVRSIRIENQGEFLMHALLSRLTDRQGFYSSSATKRFCEFIKHYNPDVIHLHNLHGYYLNLKILFRALYELNKPIVITLHDCWVISGHCAYIGDCSKWRNGCGSCPKTHTYPSALVDQSARNFIDKKRVFTLPLNMTVVTPSNWLAGLAKQSFLNKYPIKVIPNGIDPDVFKPVESDFKKQHGIKTNEKMVLGVANFRDQNKGLDDFIALSKVIPDCRFVLVGLSEKQISTLPEGLIGLCRVNDPAELARIYCAADIFVNPTYADNFPSVNLEALACGVPVVTYDTGGSGEAIGTCGAIVMTKDREALAKAVIRCLSDPPSRAQCRAQALAYDKDIRFEEYLRLYHQLTGESAK